VSYPAKAKMPYFWLYSAWHQGASLSVVLGNLWDVESKFAAASSNASVGTWKSLEGRPCTILNQRHRDTGAKYQYSRLSLDNATCWDVVLFESLDFSKYVIGCNGLAQSYRYRQIRFFLAIGMAL